MSKCGGCSGNGKGGKSGGSEGKSAISKYSGGGDSGRNYAQALRVNAVLYPSDTATGLYTSAADRYAMPKTANQKPYFALRTPMERYSPPKAHESDMFYVIEADRTQRLTMIGNDKPKKSLQFKRPASAPDKIYDEEELRRKYRMQGGN